MVASLAGALAIGVASLAVMATVTAAAVTSCGDYLSYTNMRAQGTSCSTARRVARAEYRYPHGLGSAHVVAGFRCRARFGPNAIHHRCVRGKALVKFEEA